MVNAVLVVLVCLAAAVAVLLFARQRAEGASGERDRPEEGIHLYDANVAQLWRSMRVIVDRTHDKEMAAIEREVLLACKIVASVRRDELGCVVPDRKKAARLRQRVRVVVPESGAFAAPNRAGALLGDAEVGQEAVIHQKNMLLEILKSKSSGAVARLRAVELDLDASGDKFKRRFSAKVTQLEGALQQKKVDLVRECAAQRSRLGVKYQQLMNHEFIDESYVSRESVPRYVHGTDVTPVQPVEPAGGAAAGVAGLVREFAKAASWSK